MSASKAERILTGLFFVNSDAIIKIFLSSVFQVHISSGEFCVLLLCNYCYVVNCIVFEVSKKVVQSYHCNHLQSLTDNYKKLDAFLGPDTCREISPL